MKKILILLVAFTTVIVSCKKDFGDLNDNTKQPVIVPPGTLFSFAQKSLSDIMTSTNVNNNVFRLFAQQWTETTYTDESNYDLATRNIPQNFWNTVFTSVLLNLNDGARLVPLQSDAEANAAERKNQAACIELLEVYTFATLVNTYGDVPYSEALNATNVVPKYDNAETIYLDLMRRLDAALTAIDAGADGFGSNDLMFGGDMGRWKTFGNSLKLRMAMIIADSNDALAKTAVSAAESNAVQTNADNIVFQYLSAPPNVNPVWSDLIQSGRKDFVAANTMVNAMIALNDPRIPLYFTTDATGAYSGGIYGASNNYSTYSKPNATLTAADYPAMFFDASETHFLHAEAIERGYIVGDAAAEYAEGIRASIEAWGGTQAEADAYLAQPSVAYATAAGNWKQKIGTQSWIALYNRGHEAWTTWRRLDYPVLTPPTDANSAVPLRYTYPVQEQNLNTANYTAAAAAIGGDIVETKLFWDKF
jgi:Starch-binding associating with outer membrane